MMQRAVWGGFLLLGLIGLSALSLNPALSLASSATGATPTPFVEPDGCWQPPDDYTRVWVAECS
jgi:hypothetical protein